MEFHDLCARYTNDADFHGKVFDDFYQKVQGVDWLKAHRDWVETNQWGLGDRPFHWMWKIAVDVMPQTFKLLEIGCYRGQILSLIGLLAKHADKAATIYGVSPFKGTHDAINSYDAGLDYISDIRRIFHEFQVDSDFVPIQGLSQNRQIIAAAREYAPFDIVYIDGAHEYDMVVLDIQNYAPMVASSGLLVVDDASNFLNMPPFSQDKGYNRCWPGLPSVSQAVKDYLETREDFVHRFAVGHNRVFQRV